MSTDNKFEKEYNDFVAKLKILKNRQQHKPKPAFDWYDGYNHTVQPHRPPHPHPHPNKPKQPCVNCRPKDLDQYGFVPVVGGKYYTGSGKACCPVKVTITKILANEIRYKDAANVEHSKTYHDFMTSSWRDKSL